ncbi:MAG TPA: hypothetical protein EYP18_02135 [Desulfobacterales bacterium]|nr:hypothetical protein [Desulfobacterales bacterium]
MIQRQNKSIAAVTGVILFVATIFSWQGQGYAADTIQLDILYMNHGPMRPTVAKIKDLLANYGDTVQASWHDVDQKSGKTFIKKHKILGHVPMLIMIDGESDFSIDGRDVQLQGFPTGASPFKRVEGNWSLDDLQLLLDKNVR